MDDVSEAELPSVLTPMSPGERRSYVQSKLKRRKEINGEIAEVSAARDTYVRAEQARQRSAGKPDGFDAKVMEAIRVQAAAKGIEYAH